MEKIYENFNKGEQMEKRCRRVINNQNEIINRIDEMIVFQNCLGTFLTKFNKVYQEKGL